MKKMLLAICLLILCAGCIPPQQEIQPAARSLPLVHISTGILADNPTQNAFGSLLDSYYAAQEEPAYAYIQKNRIKRFMTEHWTSYALAGIQNQQWHFDSFARYVVLDSAGAVISDDLYYCTFSADNDRYGFIVVKYFEEYPAIQNQGVTGTEYLYDLRALAEKIAGAMEEAGADLSTATAIRGRLGSDEIILFVGNGGSRYAFDLATFEVAKI